MRMTILVQDKDGKPVTHKVLNMDQYGIYSMSDASQKLARAVLYYGMICYRFKRLTSEDAAIFQPAIQIHL